jgi:glycyl-tRNA synthetase beta chain
MATVKETMGPSKAVAFDSSGQPTRAAIGFAGSQGVAVRDLEVRQTPKGEYLFAVKREPGRLTGEVLSEILPALVGELSFPKAMRWNETGVRFARPIRWLMAVYGRKTVEFQIAGVTATNRTLGHRFLGHVGSGTKQGLQVQDLKSYMKILGRHGVVPDQERRRTMILAQIESLTKSAHGLLYRDEELLEQAIHTVEYPHAILGEFSPQYLSLPKEILMTAMKEHQGFFSVMRKGGTLLPLFISVTNMKLPNMRLIREGNERVLAARLADAKFFFEEDRKTRLEDRIKKLTQVTFHQKLGTVYQKQERITKLAALLASMLSFPPDAISSCRRAAQLCKADLLTGIVGEFPALQGIMGGEYARHDGESEEVSRAIAEQYLPPSMDGPLPQTNAGKVLSLADRLDSITAFFRVGIVPTGSEDPLGLRRHANAIVRILIEGNLRLGLFEAVEQAEQIQAEQIVESTGITAKSQMVHGGPFYFILDRLRYYAGTVGGVRRDDVIAAVCQRAGPKTSDLVDLLSRMKALEVITKRPEFDPLMVGFKRAHRLVEKEKWTAEEVDPALLQHPTEVELHKVLNEAKLHIPYSIEQGNYAKALDGLVRLRPAIDAFFVGVMVNSDDPGLRANRLSLLCAIDRLFMSFADFSQIIVQGN